VTVVMSMAPSSGRLAALGSVPRPGTLPAHAPAQALTVSGGTAEIDRVDVARVLAGDLEAFAVLVDRHQGRITSHLTRLVGRTDAEDLAQDTFVRAYQALDRYDATYPFRGWLLVIASRLAASTAPSPSSPPTPVPSTSCASASSSVPPNLPTTSASARTRSRCASTACAPSLRPVSV
jgi:RNA polymerase sigma-70 factor, ECF subfamily